MSTRSLSVSTTPSRSPPSRSPPSRSPPSRSPPSRSPPSRSPKRSIKNSSITEEKLDDLLREWSKVKRQISELEGREKSIKELIVDIMKEEGVDSLYTDNYGVVKRIQKRLSVSQKDLPDDIWKRYAKSTEFPVFYLKRV
jgi:predicted phage-related endonuclease